MTGRLTSRVPAADYRSWPALNISRLKEMRRSPLHYQHALANPKTSRPMTLGTAAHTATLEPERIGRDYAVWDRRAESGRLAPRTGKVWEAFALGATADGRQVLTEDEYKSAMDIAIAVRSDPVAAKYLEAGEPEVTMEWDADGRPCKGRADWITHLDDEPVVVGLKTAQDCRHWQFSAVAARLGYAMQWAFYRDGWFAIKGSEPRMVEIVVESTPPHAVAVYVIPEDVIDHGRAEYLELLRKLADCETRGQWPGPAETELVFALPAWVTSTGDDITDLELEM